jgi:hypothetical protein
LIVEVSVTHTIRHTHTPGRTPLNKGQLITEVAANTTNTKRQTTIPSAGFEPAIPAIEWPQNRRHVPHQMFVLAVIYSKNDTHTNN